MSFFQGFTFDTLLGCISCIIGVFGLFFGAKAYKKCKVIDSEMNDHKEFYDNGTDYSQRASGDIINNNCDVDAMYKMTTANFERSLNLAYSKFEHQNEQNIRRILELTKHIIQENRISIGSLTKIDWINIYFETAKNTSDEYMQMIWSRVLARELEKSGSFSYKTLDVLKNMSSEDFIRFEKLSSMEIDGWIMFNGIHEKYGLEHIDVILLSEMGLINSIDTVVGYTFSPLEEQLLPGQMASIRIKNMTDEEIKISFEVRSLSSAAKELCSISKPSYLEEYMNDNVNELRKKSESIRVSLQKNDKGYGAISMIE